MGYWLHSDAMYLETGKAGAACLRTEGEGIVSVGCQSEPGDQVIELTGLTLLPGFLDIHVHGGNGFDAMDGSYESINQWSRYKLREGVTAFCPSTATDGMERTEAAIVNIKAAMQKGVDGAKVIGTFLEGPYISKKYKGAHEESLIRDISLGEIQHLIDIGDGSIISCAISPELEQAPEAVRLLRAHNINVRIGHSNATYDEVCRSIEAGANIAIHTYNAMRPLNHQELGMLGAALTRDDLYSEVICDFVHVQPEAVKLLYRAKSSGRVILITDCMMAGGLCDGTYTLGAKTVTVRGSAVRTAEGALAGSTLTIAKAVANMGRVPGVTYGDLVKMSSSNPAKALGLFDQIGSIAVGKKADLVGLDANLEVQFVMVDGVIKIMNGDLL